MVIVIVLNVTKLILSIFWNDVLCKYNMFPVRVAFFSKNISLDITSYILHK